MYMYVASYILYNAKLLWDKTFAVRSPCEYSFTEKTHICIKTTFTSAKALRGKYLRFTNIMKLLALKRFVLYSSCMCRRPILTKNSGLLGPFLTNMLIVTVSM